MCWNWTKWVLKGVIFRYVSNPFSSEQLVTWAPCQLALLFGVERGRERERAPCFQLCAHILTISLLSAAVDRCTGLLDGKNLTAYSSEHLYQPETPRWLLRPIGRSEEWKAATTSQVNPPPPRHPSCLPGAVFRLCLCISCAIEPNPINLNRSVRERTS